MASAPANPIRAAPPPATWAPEITCNRPRRSTPAATRNTPHRRHRPPSPGCTAASHAPAHCAPGTVVAHIIRRIHTHHHRGPALHRRRPSVPSHDDEETNPPPEPGAVLRGRARPLADDQQSSSLLILRKTSTWPGDGGTPPVSRPPHCRGQHAVSPRFLLARLCLHLGRRRCRRRRCCCSRGQLSRLAQTGSDGLHQTVERDTRRLHLPRLERSG